MLTAGTVLRVCLAAKREGQSVRGIARRCRLSPDADWVIEAMEKALNQHGPPAEIVSDRDPVLTSAARQALLSRWGIRQGFGRLGEPGSIAVTERAILTLKEEWLRRVPVIRGLDHLRQLLRDFEIYYNEYRGHARPGGAIPSVIHRGEQWAKPEKSAKTLPPNVERRFFPGTQITAYRLAA
jgi:transposase InsO family protein